jgi:hypothetical protein
LRSAGDQYDFVLEIHAPPDGQRRSRL